MYGFNNKNTLIYYFSLTSRIRFYLNINSILCMNFICRDRFLKLRRNCVKILRFISQNVLNENQLY